MAGDLNSQGDHVAWLPWVEYPEHELDQTLRSSTVVIQAPSIPPVVQQFGNVAVELNGVSQLERDDVDPAAGDACSCWTYAVVCRMLAATEIAEPERVVSVRVCSMVDNTSLLTGALAVESCHVGMQRGHKVIHVTVSFAGSAVGCAALLHQPCFQGG